MRAHQQSRRPVHSLGFTLIELMVAIVLSLFLMIGLISLLVSTVNSRSELDKTGRQIENGRYALQLLSEDIQMAGFVGASSSTTFATVAPVACPTNVAALGYFAMTSPGTSTVPLPIYGLNSTPACISNVMAGTAMLVLTRVNTNVVSPAAAVATEAYLQVSTCANDTLPFAAASGASAASFPLMQKNCLSSNLAPLRKIMQRVYFVSTCNACGTDTIPTLKLAEYLNGEMVITPLVEGIENLQLDYGVDMDGNGSPDCYTSNPGSPPAAQIAAAVCPQTTPPYDWTAAMTNWTNVMRHVYSTVARLYNSSGQRETP
jgi:type IV pilus assembly protein PilW